MLVLTIALGPLPLADVGLQAASAGKPEQVKETAVVKPVEAMMPTVVVPEMPGLVTLTSVGPANPAKPGCMGKVAGGVLLLKLKLGSPAQLPEMLWLAASKLITPAPIEVLP